jgi:predicted nucleic acid-binding protein
MPSAISNTSPLVYLYRIQVIEWLPRLFDEVWIPAAVADELKEGQRRGFDVPNPAKQSWLRLVNPKAMPVEWLALDLGAGELAAMRWPWKIQPMLSFSMMLARRTGQAAGLNVWGTLKVLLEGKAQGITKEVRPLVNKLEDAGMWLSADVRRRILKLAHEGEE